MIQLNFSPRKCILCHEEKSIHPPFIKNGYRIVKCNTCSLIYTNELPQEPELAHIYSAEYYGGGSKYAGEHSASILNSSNNVKELLALPEIRRDTWLDVGCAIGDFIAAAQKDVSQLYGVEVSTFAAAQARIRGLKNIYSGTLFEANFSSEQFDLVSLWDVIEHVTDPLAVLQESNRILKPGGYLALSTGDIGSFMARLMGKYWHLMTPQQHLYFFTAETMRSILEKTGFGNVIFRYKGKRVALDFMFRKLTQTIVPGMSDVVLRLSNGLRLGKIVPVVNLWDIMTVYTRKE